MGTGSRRAVQSFPGATGQRVAGSLRNFASDGERAGIDLDRPGVVERGVVDCRGAAASLDLHEPLVYEGTAGVAEADLAPGLELNRAAGVRSGSSSPPRLPAPPVAFLRCS